MKTAIIDVGSNTIRLSVYNTFEDGTFELLFSKKETAGLAGYIRHGKMSQSGIEKACGVLQSFQSLLHLLEVEVLHVFATASLRNIINTDEAIHRIYQETGILVDVISGKLEANLGCCGALDPLRPEKAAIFDIGGGSTGLVEVRSHEIYSSQSLAMGSLNLFNLFVSRIWPKDKELEKMTRCIQETFRQADLPERKLDRIYGIGGTARAALRIINDYFGKDSDCRAFSKEELSEITNLLLERNSRTRELILNNCPDRVHTVIPGILILNTLSGYLAKDEIRISKYGVREGYLCHRVLKNTI